MGESKERGLLEELLDAIALLARNRGADRSSWGARE